MLASTGAARDIGKGMRGKNSLRNAEKLFGLKQG